MTDSISTWSETSAIITAAWGGRDESTAQLAERLATLITALAALSPEFAGPWFPSEDDRVFRTTTTIADWQEFIEDSVVIDDNGLPEPSSGYSPVVRARRHGTTDTIYLRVHGGSEGGYEGYTAHRLTMTVDPKVFGRSVDLTTLEPVLPELIRTLVAIWKPDWAGITTRDANRPQFKKPWGGWPVIGAVTWLSSAVSDVPPSLRGAEVRAYCSGTLIGVPSLNHPAHNTAAILAVRDELVEASAIRIIPAYQAQ